MKARPAALILTLCAIACAAGASSAGGFDGDGQASFETYLRSTLRDVQSSTEPDASVRHAEEAPVKPKSTLRAVLLSALVPGLGEIYVGGKRGYVTGGVFVGIDVISIYKFYELNSEGDDLRAEYRDYARRYYDSVRFEAYVKDTIAAVNPNFEYCQIGDQYDPAKCDSLVDYYFPLADPATDDDFYEQIDTADRFAFGWTDWVHQPEYVNYWNQWEDPEGPIPSEIETETARRLTYRSMRNDANDAYASADKFAWIMVIGRVVSMVDALILTRAHNSRLASLGSNVNLSFQVKSITDPAFKVGVKMRF